MRITTLPGLICLCALLAASSHGGEPAPDSSGVKRSTIPDRKPAPPDEKGKRYPVPATNWEKKPIIWGWSCELPDGSGMMFGGVHQTSDDGRSHTCLKAGTEWKPIHDELRKNNVLQKHFDTACALRNTTKDTLARARHLYFEGKTAAEEGKLLQADVNPAIEKLLKDIGTFGAELKALSSLAPYEAGQVKLALQQLEAALAQIKSFGAQTTPEQMAAMRRGQIALETASVFLDSEPPPRALSLIAWDAKNKVYVIFGGDHTDYVTNDLWVFDPAKRKWFQKHQDAAPEPRADHQFDGCGDGRIAMSGGYTYAKGFTHVGPARWIYDVEKNTWTADGHQEKPQASGSRTGGYDPPSMPENFMKGPRPDAAAHEAKLKALPVNTWVKLESAVPLGGRDWATWPHDTDRDMLYIFAGGHASYCGNDVARYHLATGRFEISDPVEYPLGGIGSNEQYPAGFNFNRRPWCRPHVWNSQTYDTSLKKMVLGGSTIAAIDPNVYLYDPDKSDWVSRHRVAEGMNNGVYGLQLRSTKNGTFGWVGTDAWLMDPKALTWKKVATNGKMPTTAVDSCGMAYDAKRDRMLLFTLGGYAKPYDGQVHALELATGKVAPLNPAGLETAPKTWRIYLREYAYHPESDIFVSPQMLDHIGGKPVPDHVLGYDAGKNRWVMIKTPGAVGQPFVGNCVCTSLNYDAKRGLFWLGDSSWNGAVWVMRFDHTKAEIKPLTDFPPPAPAAPAEKK